MLKGITVGLHAKTMQGVDDFGAPVYSDAVIQVDDVLVGAPSGDEVVTELQLTGKRLAYTLGVPKGDTNNWEDTEVEFFNEKFRTYGKPTQGIEDMIPLRWNKKVKVERYD